MVTTTSTNSFLPENIPALVSHLLSNQPASFHLDTADKPFSGSQPHVYVVKVTDGSTWGVRVPIPQANHMSRESITFCVEEEVKILNGIEQSGFSKSPRLLGYDSGYDNAIGFPYIVLTWIEGSPAEWPDSIPASRITRNKFLRQLAKIMLELAECTQKPCKCFQYPLLYLLNYFDSYTSRQRVSTFRHRPPNPSHFWQPTTGAEHSRLLI